MDGLTIKNGRLINNRRDGESGLERMSRLKRAYANERKINQIAEGMERAEYKKNYTSKLF